MKFPALPFTHALATLALLASPQATFGEHDSREVVPGTVQWHYDPDNKVMEEGHKRIREWREEVEAERLLLLGKMHTRKGLPKAGSGGDDTLRPPLPMGTEHTFAKGMVRGKWLANRITNTTSGAGYGSGVRLDRTVHDPERNIIYALTTEKNLVEAPLTQLGSWVQRNQVVFIEKKGFTGVKVPGGAFRLIGSINGELRYSDDQGKSWALSAGGAHDRGAVYFTEAMADGSILTQVRKRVGSVPTDAVMRSTDFGKTFRDIQTWPASQSSGIVTTKLYNTDDHCILVRNRGGGGTWEIHQYKGGAFSLLATASATGTPSTITGTFHEGIKVYVGTSSNGGYYSNGGTSWVARPTLKSRLETVHPTQPNLLFSNSAQHDYSDDGGLTWRAYPSNDNTIGWDPKHLAYYKVKGIWTFVVANDMGLCFNADPLNRNTWQYVNDNHSYAILHGGTAVDHTNLTVTSNQDPGTFELTRTGTGAYSARNKNSADGLRAAASNNGTAFWYRHYWEAFMHSHAAFTKDTRKATYNMPNTWYTPPFKGTTAPGEDAIYVSGHNQLVKLTYNPSSNSITRTNLPHDFQAATGQVTWGVGTAKSDPARVYVATRNGRFFHSSNAGQTWTETTYGGTKPTPQTSPAYNQSTGFFIEVADTDANLVYWGGGSGSAAVLISRDGGKTFAPAVTGLPSGEKVGSLSLSPDGRLAFSTNFYVYIASENAWFDLKAESMPTGALPYANGVNYLPLQRKVRYFTWGAGVVDLDITHLATPDFPAPALDPGKCYRITASHSGKALGLGAGDIVQQSAPIPGTSQTWQFLNLDGFYRIADTDRGRVLEVPGESHVEATAVTAGNWAGTDNQKWNVVRDGEGEYALVVRHSVKALEVAAASTADGAKIQQATYFSKPGQKWRIAEQPGCIVTQVPMAGKPSGRLTMVPNGKFGYRIVYGSIKAFQILVFDAFGKRVRLASDTDVFDLSGLPGGLYYVKIRTDHIHAIESIAYSP